MAHRARLSRIKTGDWAWPFRGPRVERVSPSRHLMHCRVCFLGGRKGRFSPLTSALRHDHRNACPSPRFPAAGRFQFAPSATCPIQLRHYALKSQHISQRHSSDAHAAPNLDQIEKIDDAFDAVGLSSIPNPSQPRPGAWGHANTSIGFIFAGAAICCPLIMLITPTDCRGQANSWPRTRVHDWVAMLANVL